MNPLIVIPSRMKATRLPNKPLALIAGEPMILHVWRRAVAAGVGPVVVACGDQEIFDVITASGGSAVMTDPDLPSGSDRVYAAVTTVDPDRDFDVIVNVQGDLPTLEPTVLQKVLAPLENPAVDIATLANAIHDEQEAQEKSVVKIALALKDGETIGRALYFSRAAIPTGDIQRWHHIGIYAYRRASLERFVGLPVHPLEKSESLEQLRALADDMRIDCAVVHTTPFGVDTPADLEKARTLIHKTN
ncbi:3-deoxy-manno-octulosonate cytidylyltransferase [Lacibacterium aquatile]|uniref:3-deoxy-manno-octulosonate cytidylyltransferase n=1 Tax=Lacibacterium aquatile TaxID=1168082 RepID=A0ABW5DLT7_9PROT